MSTGWNTGNTVSAIRQIINLLGNEYWLEHFGGAQSPTIHYKPTGK